MRLTLRTLLAYLDDTLEPLEIKKIGQKVGESDTAQELIARIKQVTRRRRITTPPTAGQGAFDPNTVADYLDNELSPEQVAELEKICLESDVHLAEIASCHQILTLVLGEPALVPPTAKERMYALVHGREAIPFRKAQTTDGAPAAPTAADADADEMFLLGLPFYRRGSWLRWALPVAGVVLLAVVGVALWQSIGGMHDQAQTPPPTQVAENNSDKNPPVPQPDKISPSEIKNKGNTPQNKESVKESGKNDSQKASPTEPTESEKTKQPDNPPPQKNSDTTPPKKPEKVAGETIEDEPPPSKPAATLAERQAKPSEERTELGNLHFEARNPPSVFVYSKGGKEEWQRLQPGKRVSSSDRLVSLPGYKSELRLDNGVHLLLWGNLKELTPSEPPELMFLEYLQECAITLHKSKDVDVDVTLSRGRLYISNHKNKGAALVRLRFENKVWDVRLRTPDTEIVVDLIKRYRADVDYMRGEGPLKTLFLLVLRGKASLSAEQSHFSDLAKGGPDIVQWDSDPRLGLRGPDRSDEQTRAAFAKTLRSLNRRGQDMELPMKLLNGRLQPGKDPVNILKEEMAKPGQPGLHHLAIYCLGAMDEVKALIDILGERDASDREAAIFSLRRWLGRDEALGAGLFDVKKGTSALLSPEYSSQDAQTIFVLLHDLNDEQIGNREFLELLANDLMRKTAIAELARWQLYRLSRSYGINIPSLDSKKFNAADTPDKREAASKAVKQLIVEGKLPPRDLAPPTPKAPGTGRGTKKQQ